MLWFTYNDIINVMKTIIKKLEINEIDKEIIEQAGQILREGGLVAFPTETVYGLGADALNEKAAEKTYAAKGRPSDNPLIVHIAEIGALEKIAENIPVQARSIAERFWPGPLTMVFEKSALVPYGTTGGLDTVAVRMPDNTTALDLIRAGGGYISAPSANTSGRPSPTNAQHVAEDLDGKIDMIVDGGSVEIGVESTILDMTVTPPMILRPGAITPEMLETVIGEVAVDETVVSEKSTQSPKAPGMKYRHYAPKAELIVVEGKAEEAVKAIKQIAYEQTRLGYKVGIIGTSESLGEYTVGMVKSIGSRENEKSVARNLYKILREFDEENVDYIYSEAFSTEGIGNAVMNRLGKAAGHHVLLAETITRLQRFRSIVFVSNSDNCRGPMAAALLRRQPLLQEYAIYSRGMVALFPEPLNPIAEEILKEHDIVLNGHETTQLSGDIFKEDTLVLTMEQSQKEKILGEYPDVSNVYTIYEYVEEEEAITTSYGQALEQYEEMYGLIKAYIIKLANKLNEEAKGECQTCM